MDIQEYREGMHEIFLDAFCNPRMDEIALLLIAVNGLRNARTDEQRQVIFELSEEMFGFSESLLTNTETGNLYEMALMIINMKNLYDNMIPVVVDENGKTTNFENLGRELRDGEMIKILRR